MRIKRFVERLARGVVSAETTNQYAHNWTKDNALRRHNLQVYLQEMSCLQPTLLLVGEAVGYRGGCITGVPFVSPKQLLTHPFYTGWDFRPIITTPIYSEASSSIVHDVCQQLAIRPLHWNAYPFHPHQRQQLQSNRKPTAAELVQGGQFLRELMQLFEIEQVVAVGNSAEKSLLTLGIPHTKVRHPAHGGKQAFTEGLQRVVALW